MIFVLNRLSACALPPLAVVAAASGRHLSISTTPPVKPATPLTHRDRAAVEPRRATLCRRHKKLGQEALLPIIINDRVRFDATWIYYAGAPMASLYLFALILLWFRQRRTVLGLWLIVVTCVHLVGVPLSFYPPPTRFSVGWYTVVIMNFWANSLVLVVLLAEISKLYARTLLGVRAQHREREAQLVACSKSLSK
jgi:hypothetical protein